MVHECGHMLDKLPDSNLEGQQTQQWMKNKSDNVMANPIVPGSRRVRETNRSAIMASGGELGLSVDTVQRHIQNKTTAL